MCFQAHDTPKRNSKRNTHIHSNRSQQLLQIHINSLENRLQSQSVDPCRRHHTSLQINRNNIVSCTYRFDFHLSKKKKQKQNNDLRLKVTIHKTASYQFTTEHRKQYSKGPNNKFFFIVFAGENITKSSG